MAKSQEDMLQEIVDGQRAMLTAISRSGAAKSGGSVGGMGALESGFSTLTQASGGVASAFGSLTKSLLTGSDDTLKSVLNFSTSIMGSVPLLKNFTGILGSLGEIGIQNVEGLKESIKYGATFGQDLGLYSKIVAQSRESVQTFNDRLKDSGTSLNVLGATMSDAMSQFGFMAKALQESDVGNNLKLSGWSAKELNDVLTTSVTVRKFTDFHDDRSKKSAIESAQRLAVELDNTARFTGMSREEAQKKVKEDLEKPDVVAMLLTLTEEQQTAFLENETKMASFSDRVRDSLIERATGGIRSAEGQITAAAMSGRENMLLDQMAKLSTSSRAEDREQYDRLKKEFEVVHAQANVDRAQTAQLLSRSGSDVGKAMIEMMRSPAATAGLALKREAARLEISPEELQKRREQQAAQEIQGITAKGETAPESAVFRASQAIDKLRTDVIAGTTIEFNKLNKQVGETLIGFDLYAKALRAHAAEEVNVINELKELLLGERDQGTPDSEAAQAATSPSGGGQWRGAAAGEVQGEWRGTETTAPIERRAGGTLSATGGSLLEDWGIESLVKLHGNEGVITDDQLNNMYSNVAGAMQTVGNKTVQPTIQQVSLPPDFMKSIDKTMQGDSYDYGFLIDKLNTQQLDMALSNDQIREKLELMNRKYSSEAHMVDSSGMQRLEARLNQLHDKPAVKSVTSNQDQAHNAAMIKYLESISTKTVGIDMGAINETANKTTESLKTIAPGVKIFTDELRTGSTQTHDSLKTITPGVKIFTDELATGGIRTKAAAEKYASTIADGEKIKSAINLSKELDTVAKSKNEVKPVTIKQPTVKVEKSESKGLFDQISDIMYGIGNFAGKQYDDITDKFTKSMPKLEHIEFNPIPEANAGLDKTLESLGVSQMKSESSLEEFKNSMYEIPEVVGIKAQSAFEKTNETVPTLDKEIREMATNFFGQGAKSTVEVGSTTSAEVAQKQSETVHALSEQRAKEAEAASMGKLEKMFENVVLPTEKNAPVEDVRTFEATSEVASMNDVKSQLVVLNTSIRELINHTSEVANNSRAQVKATSKVLRNNIVS